MEQGAQLQIEPLFGELSRLKLLFEIPYTKKIEENELLAHATVSKLISSHFQGRAQIKFFPLNCAPAVGAAVSGKLLLDPLPHHPRPSGRDQLDLHSHQRLVALYDSERQVGPTGSNTEIEIF